MFKLNQETSILSKVQDAVKSPPSGIDTSYEVSEIGLKLQARLGESLTTLSFPVSFDLILSESFPSTPGILRCVTAFTFPSLADGRDLMCEILGRRTKRSIKGVLKALPKLVKTLLNTKDVKSLQLVGRFHEDMVLETSTWSKEGMKFFPGPSESVALTHTSVLILESVNDSLAKFSNCLFITDVNNISRAHSTVSLEYSRRTQKLNVELFDAELFISLLGENLNKLDPSFTVHKKEDPEQQLIKDIRIAEANMNSAVTLNTVNTVLGLYAQAIEFYSAKNDGAFQEYLLKTNSLLANEHVQNAINKRILGEPVEEAKAVVVVEKELFLEEVNLEHLLGKKLYQALYQKK